MNALQTTLNDLQWSLIAMTESVHFEPNPHLVEMADGTWRYGKWTIRRDPINDVEWTTWNDPHGFVGLPSIEAATAAIDTYEADILADNIRGKTADYEAWQFAVEHDYKGTLDEWIDRNEAAEYHMEEAALNPEENT